MRDFAGFHRPQPLLRQLPPPPPPPPPPALQCAPGTVRCAVPCGGAAALVLQRGDHLTWPSNTLGTQEHENVLRLLELVKPSGA